MATHDYTEQCWGHAVSMIDSIGPEKFNMLGHGSDIKEKDTLTLKMQSGRIGEFEVLEVEYFMDPRDMWKLKAKFIGYASHTTKGGSNDGR